MISNFPDRLALNIGGLSSFLFTPINKISQFPPVSGKVTVSPVIFTSGDFFTGYATLETLKFTESPTIDDNGTSYGWKVEGFTPGDSAALVQLMEDMELVRHVVVTKDMTGLLRLVGYNAPLDFAATFSPGDDVSSARGYNFVFSGSAPKRAPVYVL